MLGPARGRRAATRIGAAFGLAAGLVALIGIQDLFGASRVVRADSFLHRGHRAHQQTTAQTAGPDAKPRDTAGRSNTSTPAPTLRGAVQVDSTAVYQGPAADAHTVCALPSPASAGSADALHADWEQWCALTGTRLSAKSCADSLPVYAARVPSGVAVLIVNHSEGPADLQLAVRTTRGVYTVERCCVDLPVAGAPASPNAADSAVGAEAAPAQDHARVERLESVILGGKGTIRKPVRLPAAGAVVYRITNRSAQTQSAFDAAMKQVRSVRSGHSGAYGRLMTPLGECANNVARLSDGIQPDERYGVLRYVHRALLTLAQAQALCRNFQSEGRLPEQKATALGSALDGLEESLSELSGACLGLVPGIVVEPPSADHPDTRVVEVTVANAGSESIAYVKIGAAAGKGCSVQPADLALFRELKPGEVAKARFTVKLADDDAVHSIAADIAWLAAKVPARLKVRNL